MKSITFIIFLSFTCFKFSLGQEKIDINFDESCSFYGEEIDEEIYGFSTSNEAIKVVEEIVRQVGLKRNFTIIAGNVPNAVANVRQRPNGAIERYIIYSQSFMIHIINETNSYWSAIGIMAHEVGHHLNNHVLNGEGGSRPPTELEADEFAGFILYKLGATLLESQSMFNNSTMYQPNDSYTHPKTSARLEAVAVGWQRAKEIGPIDEKETDILPNRSDKKNEEEYELNEAEFEEYDEEAYDDEVPQANAYNIYVTNKCNITVPFVINYVDLDGLETSAGGKLETDESIFIGNTRNRNIQLNEYGLTNYTKNKGIRTEFVNALLKEGYGVKEIIFKCN